jgi:hypothetical protein
VGTDPSKGPPKTPLNAFLVKESPLNDDFNAILESDLPNKTNEENLRLIMSFEYQSRVLEQKRRSEHRGRSLKPKNSANKSVWKDL